MQDVETSIKKKMKERINPMPLHILHPFDFFWRNREKFHNTFECDIHVPSFLKQTFRQSLERGNTWLSPLKKRS